MEMRGSKHVSIFNTFSNGVENIVMRNTNSSGIHLVDDNQRGGTSGISCWFPENSEPGGEVICIGPQVYETHTAQSAATPCVFAILPLTTLPGPTTIGVSPCATGREAGASRGGSFVVTTTTAIIITGTVVTEVARVRNMLVKSIVKKMCDLARVVASARNANMWWGQKRLL